MSELLTAKIEVPCPKCGAKMRPTLGDVQRGRTVTCPRGHKVTLSESGSGIRRADKALDDFAKSMKRLSSKISRR